MKGGYYTLPVVTSRPPPGRPVSQRLSNVASTVLLALVGACVFIPDARYDNPCDPAVDGACPGATVNPGASDAAPGVDARSIPDALHSDPLHPDPLHPDTGWAACPVTRFTNATDCGETPERLCAYSFDVQPETLTCDAFCGQVEGLRCRAAWSQIAGGQCAAGAVTECTTSASRLLCGCR